MLEVSSLNRSYGDFRAVADVSFRIGRGEVVGLLGHNGAGKTTIMKIISGYLEPDTGQVTFNDLDLTTSLKTVQRQIGYLPESLPVYPDMSVAYFLDYAASLKGLDGDQRREEIRRVVEATEIGSKVLSPIGTLSRGQKQRVGVAQALLGRPGLLILDEPTNGLDPTQTAHMRQLIRELAQDTTVILSTHIMQEVDAICDRVLIINSGRLVLDEQLDNLRRSNRLRLVCSLPADQLHSVLADMDGVAECRSGEEPRTSIITLADGAGNDAVSAAVAKAVHDQGGRLFSLAPETRSLETLFSELSSGYPMTEEVGNVA